MFFFNSYSTSTYTSTVTQWYPSYTTLKLTIFFFPNFSLLNLKNRIINKKVKFIKHSSSHQSNFSENSNIKSIQDPLQIPVKKNLTNKIEPLTPEEFIKMFNFF